MPTTDDAAGMPIPTAGPLQPATAVILYHHRTGTIFSTHYFAAVQGVALPDMEELEKVAVAHATRDGCDSRTHKALHVDPATIKRGVGYRVSVAKAALAEVKARKQTPNSLRLGVTPKPGRPTAKRKR